MSIIRPAISPETTFGNEPDALTRTKRALRAVGSGVLIALNGSTTNDRFKDMMEQEDAEVSAARETLRQKNNTILENFGDVIDGGAIFQAPFGDGKLTAKAITYRHSKHIAPDTLWSVDLTSPDGDRSIFEARVRRTRNYQNRLFADVVPIDPDTGKRFGGSSVAGHESQLDELNAASYALQVIEEARKEGTLLAHAHPVQVEVDPETHDVHI